MSYLLIADGGKKNGLAYGSFRILNNKGLTIEHKQFIIGPETHNQAEYRALNRGLEACVEMGVDDLDVFMDSKLIVNQVRGSWNTNDKKMKKLKKVTKFFIDKLDTFTIRYIPRRFIEQKLGH